MCEHSHTRPSSFAAVWCPRSFLNRTRVFVCGLMCRRSVALTMRRSTLGRCATLQTPPPSTQIISSTLFLSLSVVAAMMDVCAAQPTLFFVFVLFFCHLHVKFSVIFFPHAHARTHANRCVHSISDQNTKVYNKRICLLSESFS
jgi:hypothetical protein